MSDWYIAVNDERKEFLNPVLVGPGGWRINRFSLGDFPILFSSTMASRWLGEKARVLGEGDEYYAIEKGGEYKDVTLEAIKAFNDYWEPKNAPKILTHEEWTQTGPT